ncbi:MAG: hypothetical protein KIT83_21480 [Bryobacterales bacterium]|nr:hypothetical protein [Bryobacterales bacterium]
MLFVPRGRLRTANIIRIWLLLSLTACLSTVAAVPAATGWPLELADGPSRVIVQSPMYTNWDYLRLTMDAPVRFARGGEAPIYATATLIARTFASRPEQKLLLRDFTVAELHINSETERSATGDASPEELAKQLGRLLAEVSFEVDLTGVVATFAGKKRLPSVAISSDTPRIFVSRTPAILLQFDGPPMWLPVEGTKLSMGVNTNWDSFYDNKSTFYYLLAGDLWLASHDIYAGEWVIPKSLPKEIKHVPHTPDFELVWKNLPYKPNPDRSIPKVFFTEQAAELVLLEGDPVLEPIDGLELAWVRNTASDLFYHTGEKRYYLVIAGRWFTAAKPEDYWRSATTLPDALSRIPEDHPRGHVLAHVPGTARAEQEALWSQVPQLAKVKRREASVQIAFAGKPQYVPIDGTALLWVPNATLPVVAHAGTLYACHHAVWFRASQPQGPWQVADSLPEEIYQIPSRSAAFHLSFVRLVESDAETVTFGYSGGYKNTFVHEGAVVYGTGYGHPPALQYGAYAYPVYFAQPSTFGAGAWYSLQHHVFLRGRTGYGPYGGFGATSRYNSVTSHYFRPHGLYGVENVDEPELAFHPYTGLFGKVAVNYEPYATWGKAIIPWRTAGGSAIAGRPGTSSPPAPPAAEASKSGTVTIQVGTPVLTAPGERAEAPASHGMQTPRKKKNN